MSRIKENLDHKKIRRLIWLVLTLFVLLAYSLQSVAGSAYYSMMMQANGTVSSPPVILQNGTAGTSIIYTNKTSAKVNVSKGDFNCALNVSNLVSKSWKIRLKAYSDSGIDPLTNCTIYFHHNGANSSQIKIVNGEYVQKNGTWYDLAGNDTVFIAVHTDSTGAGTSYVYTYLEILVPDTSTYAQYIITFEIT